MAAGLYIHIPFCKKKCDYCAFYSAPPCGDDIKRYTDALISEAEKRSAVFGNKTFDSLYIGGGTPSLLNGETAERLFSSLKTLFRFEDDTEFTTEANPESLTEEYLAAFVANGGNRLSLGVQSLCDGECKAVGRITDKRKVFSAIDTARKYGIRNISCDLLLGLPGQTVGSLSDSINQLTEKGITHLSLYSLKKEAGTPLFERMSNIDFPDEDEEFELYRYAVELLKSKGFGRYEISNFAVNGKESRHNLKYWKSEEYLGLGVSAHSFMNGKRFYNLSDTARYSDGENLSQAEEASFCDENSSAEKMMLLLRLSEGLPLSFFSEEKRQAIDDFLRKLQQNGLAENDEEKIVLTDSGLWVMNSIIIEIDGIVNG